MAVVVGLCLSLGQLGMTRKWEEFKVFAVSQTPDFKNCFYFSST
jgi:hypothetical protein